MVLAGLACGVAQLVAHAGAHVAQLFLGHGLVGSAQAGLDGLAQIHLAHIGPRHVGGPREVFHVDGAQRGEFQGHGVAARGSALVGELGGATHHAFHIKRLGSGRHGHRTQLELGAPIVKAGLVNLDALVAGGVVHLHAGRCFLARGFVVDDDFAGKQLGHAGGVVLHDELLEFHRKRQLLQQHAVRLVQDRRARLRAFGHHQVATEGRVALGQAVLGLHVSNQPAARVRGLAAQQHLGAHDQITVEQTAHTHQHDGAVRCDVADLVGSPCLGGHHPAGTGACGGVTLLQTHLPAPAGQHAANAPGLGFRAFCQGRFGLVVERAQALLAHIFFIRFDIAQKFGGVASDAKGRADHQEGQDQQKPPRAVHRIELQSPKKLCPKGSKLVHVVDGRLMLLEHGANDRGNADHRQQRNGKPHGRQQFDPCAQSP